MIIARATSARMRLCGAVVAAAVAIAASAQLHAASPRNPAWSELTGERYPTAQTTRTAAIIERVDDDASTDRIVKLEPGRHAIVIRSPAWKGTPGSGIVLGLELEPCKRYFINAQFKSGGGTAWQPVIAAVEMVGGCKAPTTS